MQMLPGRTPRRQPCRFLLLTLVREGDRAKEALLVCVRRTRTWAVFDYFAWKDVAPNAAATNSWLVVSFILGHIRLFRSH